MQKLQQGIDRVVTNIAAVLLGILIVILVYNVCARFLGGGIQWYMEASKYLNVWAMLIAGVGVCVTGTHLRINALEQALKGKWKKADRILISIVTIAFYLLFAYCTYLLAAKSRQEISTMAPLKMAYVYWLLPPVGVLSAISTALHLCIDLQNPQKEEGAA